MKFDSILKNMEFTIKTAWLFIPTGLPLKQNAKPIEFNKHIVSVHIA